MITTGLNHIVLTVSDAARTRAFYEEVLGFETMPVGQGSDRGFCFQAGEVLIFCFPSSQPTAHDRFSEFRIGLDHLSFTAPDMEALQSLADRLRAHGFETKGVEQFAPTGNWYVAFRDPDNIQLEYWLP